MRLAGFLHLDFQKDDGVVGLFFNLRTAWNLSAISTCPITQVIIRIKGDRVRGTLRSLSLEFVFPHRIPIFYALKSLGISEFVDQFGLRRVWKRVLQILDAIGTARDDDDCGAHNSEEDTCDLIGLTHVAEACPNRADDSSCSSGFVGPVDW